MSLDYLKRLQPESTKSVRYPLNMISTDNGETNPTLLVRPATEVNKAFANEQMKMARKNVPAMRSGGLTVALIEDTRDNDRVLFSKYVITGWEHVVEDDGSELVFSSGSCLEFLQALPDWVFDEVRNFCGNSQNFVESVVNVEGVAKNL